MPHQLPISETICSNMSSKSANLISWNHNEKISNGTNFFIFKGVK